MTKHQLKPSQLALGESNSKISEWHGIYEGPIEHTLEKGFFKAYYQQISKGDIINMLCQGPKGTPDFISLLVVESNAKPEETIPQDDHIVVKPIVSTSDNKQKDDFDLQAFKEQLKAEVLEELKQK